MSNSLDDEQRTKNTRESSAISCSAQLPTRPASACSLFFFPPVQRHTPFSLQIPFCNLCIGSCLFPTLWGLILPIISFPSIPPTPLTPPFQLKSLSAKDKNLLWIPIIPVATLHLAFPPLTDFPKGSIYLLDSCFAPVPTDNSTFILPRKLMKQKILIHWDGNFSHQIIPILLIDSTSVAVSLFKPHLLEGMWEVEGKTWVLLPLGFHSLCLHGLCF